MSAGEAGGDVGALREAVTDWLDEVAAWQEEGLGTAPRIEQTNWPDMWIAMTEHVVTVRAALAAVPQPEGTCLRCHEEGFACDPGNGVATCGGEVCATCDNWVPDRPEDALAAIPRPDWHKDECAIYLPATPPEGA